MQPLMQYNSSGDGGSKCWYWSVFLLRRIAEPELWARDCAAVSPPPDLVDSVSDQIVRAAQSEGFSHFGWEEGRLSVLFADGFASTAALREVCRWAFVVGTLRDLPKSEAEDLLCFVKTLHFEALEENALGERFFTFYFSKLRQCLSQPTLPFLVRSYSKKPLKRSPSHEAFIAEQLQSSLSLRSHLCRKPAKLGVDLMGVRTEEEGTYRPSLSEKSRWPLLLRCRKRCISEENASLPTPLLDSAWGESVSTRRQPEEVTRLQRQREALLPARHCVVSGSDAKDADVDTFDDSVERQLAAIESARLKADALKELLLQNLHLSEAASSTAAATQASAESLTIGSAALRGAAVSLVRRERMRRARKVAVVALVAAAVFLTQRLCKT